MGKCRHGLRWCALTLAVMVTTIPHPATAGEGRRVPLPVAPQAAEFELAGGPGPQPGTTAGRRSPRSDRRSHGAPAGSDVHHDPRDEQETRAERDVVLASTWHLDPELLVVQPTDSAETVAAREELAEVNDRLPEVVATYDRARDAAARAAVRAGTATDELLEASDRATRARARWEADKALLVSSVTEAYTTSAAGPLGMLVSADTEQDLLTAMMMMQEVSDTQGTAVEDAERSRDRLQAAAVDVAVANERAQERVAAADDALVEATAARRQVLRQLRAARALLEESVLADQLAAIEARRLEAAAARAAAVAGRVVVGDHGRMSFPLPADASFVDQDNWGASSEHWAQVHTGDDLSAACGTPVLAVTDGTVEVRTDQSWSGRWLVLVSTGEGRLSTWYAHMQELLVADGASVRAGQQIGVIGAEGNATGCHLHFEVHPLGGTIYEDNTDPEEWLRAAGVHPG